MNVCNLSYFAKDMSSICTCILLSVVSFQRNARNVRNTMNAADGTAHRLFLALRYGRCNNCVDWGFSCVHCVHTFWRSLRTLRWMETPLWFNSQHFVSVDYTQFVYCIIVNLGPAPPPQWPGRKKIKIHISDFEVSCAFTDALFSSYTLLKDDITGIDRK